MGYHVLDFKLSHSGEVMLPGRTHGVDGRMIGGSRFSDNLTAMQTLPDIVLAASSDLDPKSLIDDEEEVEEEEDEDTCGRQIDETPELDADSKELNAFHGKRSKVWMNDAHSGYLTSTHSFGDQFVRLSLYRSLFFS